MVSTRWRDRSFFDVLCLPDLLRVLFALFWRGARLSVTLSVDSVLRFHFVDIADCSVRLLVVADDFFLQGQF